MELAAQLKRYGRNEEAAVWRNSAQQLGGENLHIAEAQTASGTIRGHLLLDGHPLTGVPVALFRGTDKDELLNRTRAHVQSEQKLLEQNWSPTYYQYLDFQKLKNFYAVDITDEQGYFLFEAAETGLFRLAVRLQSKAKLENTGNLINLADGAEIDLGKMELESVWQ